MLSTYIKNGNNKKYLIAIVVLVILFFTERFFHERLRLKLEKIVFNEIHKINKENTISYIDYYYFPPKIIFKKAHLKDKTNHYSVDAKSGFISLNLFSLVGGKIKLKEASLKDASALLNINEENIKPGQDRLEINLKLILSSLPLQYITIKNTALKINYKKNIYRVDLKKAFLERSDQKIWLNLESKNKIASKNENFSFDLNTDLNWGLKGIFVTAFKLKKDKSQISLTGLFNEKIIADLEKGKNPLDSTHEIRSASQINLEDINELLFLLPDKTHENLKFLENSSGELKIKGNLLAEDNLEKNREGRLKVNAQNIKTKFTNLRELSFSATVQDSKFSSKDFLLNFDEKSKLSLKTLELEKTNAGAKIKLEANSKYIELSKVLNNININTPNINIPFSIYGSCVGRLSTEDSLIKCQNKGKVFSGKVLAPSGKGAIVDINSANYNLESFITNKDIKLQVQASRQDSTASASGIIDFSKGFDIDFEAPKVSFTNFVNQIASSKLDGKGDLRGNVKGTSRNANFKVKTLAKDLEFNEFYLGDAKLEVSYLYPKVSLRNINGLIQNKSYIGDIEFDVEKDKLKIDLISPVINTTMLRQILIKKIDFPKDINFEGDLKLKASGSPIVDKMDLSLVSNLKDIQVFTENFKNGKLILNGKGGDWKIKEAILIDNERALFAKGALDGLKNIDIKLESTTYEASRLKLLSDLGLNISGPISFTLDAIGPIDGPKASGKIFSENLNGSFRKMGKVNIDYRLFQEGFSWKGDLFSNSINGDGYIPFDGNKPFAFDGELNNFDIINIISIAKDSTKKPISKLSAKFTKVKTKNLLSSTLRGDIKDASLSFESSGIDSLYIQQEKNTTDFLKNISFRVKQNDIEKSNMNFYFKNLNNMSFSKTGIVNLDFIEPFISGTEQLEGILESDFKIATRNGITKGTGASFIKGFSYRNAAFPYTFTSGSSRINWHASHAKFSNTMATLNGAQIKGEGRVSYDPSFFIDFVFKYKNLRLELPEKITSTSDGTLFVKGAKLPLSLSGLVNVDNGVFALNLLNNNSTESIQPSHLLPSSVLKQDSSPFDLDLDINLRKPFEIANAEAKGLATGGLNIHGLTSSPRMTGRINLVKGTRLIFQDKQFIVNEGNISYNNKPPENPSIFVDAESSLIDKNSLVSSKYDVRVIIKGTGSKPEVDFSSQPSLDKNQIISLIAIGTTSTQTLDQEIGEDQKATQSGLQIGSYLLQQNQAIKDFQKQTGTEIEISSSVDSGGVSPKVGINKSWTPKFSSNLSQTFGNQKKISLDNKYKINKNLSTVIKLQNSKTDDASLIINRRVPDGNVLGLDLEYNVEFK